MAELSSWETLWVSIKIQVFSDISVEESLPMPVLDDDTEEVYEEKTVFWKKKQI